MSDRIAVMSQGVALQVGDADDIYEHPNCRFVADFIGETNFLDGVVGQLDGANRVLLNVDGCPPLWAYTPDPVRVGQQVSLAVRPEKMHLRQGEYANQLRGRVADIVYIGTDTHYGVTLANGKEIRVREQNSSPQMRFLADEGDEVTIYFDADAARVLTE
jgi:spermidine/putrescine transport system ATP-binding protein